MFFNLAILAGVAIFFYIFLGRFEELSETELVRLSYLWVLPIVYGIAGKVLQQNSPGRDELQGQPTLERLRDDKKHSSAYWNALTATALAALVLFFFLEFIFPEL